jgi:hypothetical protein
MSILIHEFQVNQLPHGFPTYTNRHSFRPTFGSFALNTYTDFSVCAQTVQFRVVAVEWFAGLHGHECIGYIRNFYRLQGIQLSVYKACEALLKNKNHVRCRVMFNR